jgi:hypothetical protein
MASEAAALVAGMWGRTVPALLDVRVVEEAVE